MGTWREALEDRGLHGAWRAEGWSHRLTGGVLTQLLLQHMCQFCSRLGHSCAGCDVAPALRRVCDSISLHVAHLYQNSWKPVTRISRPTLGLLNQTLGLWDRESAPSHKQECSSGRCVFTAAFPFCFAFHDRLDSCALDLA